MSKSPLGKILLEGNCSPKMTYLPSYLVFDLVDSFLSRGVETPSYHRPFELCFALQVQLDHFFAIQGWGQASKKLVVSLDELTVTGIKVHALQVVSKILLGVEAVLPFFMVLDAPHSFRGQLILPVLGTLLSIVKRVDQGCLRFRKTHRLILLLGS